MKPKGTNFVAPIIECFKPDRRKKNGGGVIGVKYAGGFVYILNQGDEHPIFQENLVESCYLNDLSGVSIGFSVDVRYVGNYAGNVALKISDSSPIGFPYECVARVRRVDETVVWENSDLPKRKKLLRE